MRSINPIVIRLSVDELMGQPMDTNRAYDIWYSITHWEGQ